MAARVAAGPAVAVVTVVAGADRDRRRRAAAARSRPRGGALPRARRPRRRAARRPRRLGARARAARRRFRPSRAAMASVRRERWTPGARWRPAARWSASTSTYMAYRNLKSIVPLVRPGDHFDRQLADVGPRRCSLGHDPADAAAHAARHRRRDARPLRLLRRVHRVPAADDRRRARVLARPARGAPLHDGAVDQLGARRGELLPAALARPDLLRAGRVRRPARTPRSRTCRPCCSTSGSPSSPTRPRDPAEHRGVRLAAHLDELHGRARRAAARARAAPEDRALGLVRRDDASARSTWAGTTSSTTSPAWPWGPRRSGSPAAHRRRHRRRPPPAARDGGARPRRRLDGRPAARADPGPRRRVVRADGRAPRPGLRGQHPLAGSGPHHAGSRP